MNYPNGIKKQNNASPLTYRNRGMSLESDLNESNEYYREIDKAYIYKKPTPIKIVKVDYPSRDKAVIKEAYYTIPSTTDYNGIYKGKYIDFEAKETNNESYFPLENIHKHQMNHLRNIIENGGIGFLIIRFTSYNKTFLLYAKDFFNYIDNTTRKSVPYEYFLEKGHEIKEKYAPRLDYLEIIKNDMEVSEWQQKIKSIVKQRKNLN